MKADGIARTFLLGCAGAVMLALSVGSVWAVVTDYQSRDMVAKGATLVGRDLSGMTDAQVRATVEEAVSAPMLQPVTVSGVDKSFVLDPRGIVAVNVDAMVKEAFAPKANATIFERLNSRFTGAPLPVDVKPVYSIDATAIAQWVRQTATQVDRPAVDATRTDVNYAIKITPARYGARVDAAQATAQISEALAADAALSSASRAVTLPIRTIKPAVRESSFKNAIVVSLSQCLIRLYNGTKLIKTYPCAPGQPAWPTPTGDFKIVSKQANSPWINPHSAWSMTMPEVIPGGPDNPMGDRKIGIDFPGVFMHGIPSGEYSSIGTHASHGCMRMMPSAVHDLYDRVNIGDPVYIRD